MSRVRPIVSKCIKGHSLYSANKEDCHNRGSEVMHGYPLSMWHLHPQSFRAVSGKWSPSASPLVLEGPLTRHLGGKRSRAPGPADWLAGSSI